jgi:hypothetical protein
MVEEKMVTLRKVRGKGEKERWKTEFISLKRTNKVFH